jgi:hypothetical protein
MAGLNFYYKHSDHRIETLKYILYILEYPLLYSCRYKDTEEDADMTILDIGLLSGYIPDREDLNKVRHFGIS